MATAAQAEFNELMRDKTHHNGHPTDRNGASPSNRSPEDSENDDEHNAAHNNAPEDVEAPSRASMNQSRHIIPRTRFGANTGPKGVISDAQNYRDSQRKHRISLRGPNGLASKMMFGRGGGDKAAPEKVQEEEEEDDGDDLDDEFMKAWRENRLQQLQNGDHGSNMHSRERSARAWGGLEKVDGEGFLDAVDKSPAGTVVVVYIYDHKSDVSVELENCLFGLTRKHPKARFVKLHYHDAEMEPAGVPALIAYRNGDKFAGLVPLINEIPEDADVSSETLEVVLKKHQILF